MSIALLNHELQPAEANVMLFALQTMLSAVRVSITADTIRQRLEREKQKELGHQWTPSSPTQGKRNSSNSPTQKDIALTPAIWLALGVVSYNHALLAKAPLRILAPGELTLDNLTPQRWQALQEGLAAIADATALSPSSLNAAIRITRTLLEPLHVTVTLLGSEATRKYLLLEFHGGEVSKTPQPARKSSKPRILPVHDYPSTPERQRESQLMPLCTLAD